MQSEWLWKEKVWNSNFFLFAILFEQMNEATEKDEKNRESLGMGKTSVRLKREWFIICNITCLQCCWRSIWRNTHVQYLEYSADGSVYCILQQRIDLSDRINLLGSYWSVMLSYFMATNQILSTLRYTLRSYWSQCWPTLWQPVKCYQHFGICWPYRTLRHVYGTKGGRSQSNYSFDIELFEADLNFKNLHYFDLMYEKRNGVSSK